MTAAGAIGAPIGRLGVEDDHYVEANLIHKRFADDGSSALFRIMLADSTETNNEWTAKPVECTTSVFRTEPFEHVL
jgi:sucrose porin